MPSVTARSIAMAMRRSYSSLGHGAGRGTSQTGESQGFCLSEEQLTADPLHRHPCGLLVQGGEQRHHLDTVTAEGMERPGRVLPRRPGKQHDLVNLVRSEVACVTGASLLPPIEPYFEISPFLGPMISRESSRSTTEPFSLAR